MRAAEAGAAGPMLAAAEVGGRCGAGQAGSVEGLAVRWERLEWGGEGAWGPTERRYGGELASCRRPCRRTSGRLWTGVS